MRILSEQAGTKLRVMPVDITDDTPDELIMQYIEELRGNRGKSVKKASAKDGSSTSKAKRQPKSSASGSGDIGDDIAL